MPKQSPPAKAVDISYTEGYTAAMAVPAKEIDSIEDLEDLRVDEIEPTQAMDSLKVCCASLVRVKRMESALKLTIGKILLVIQDNPDTWRDLGFKSFEEFVVKGLDKVGVISRSDAFQAKSLAKLWPGLSADAVSGIAYSNLIEISKVTKEGEPSSAEWLQAARDLTRDGIRDLIATKTGAPRSETDLAAITILCSKSFKAKWKEFCTRPDIKAAAGDSMAVILEMLVAEHDAGPRPEYYGTVDLDTP